MKKKGDITTKFFGENKTSREDEIARTYVTHLAFNPDAGSDFDLRTKELREQFKQSPKSILPYLTSLRYDVLLAYDKNNKIIGHIAYQGHPDSQGTNWQAFNTYVDPSQRKRGIGETLREQLIIKAREKGIKKIRLGKGNHGYALKKNSELKEKEKELGITVNVDSGWIEIL